MLPISLIIHANKYSYEFPMYRTIESKHHYYICIFWMNQTFSIKDCLLFFINSTSIKLYLTI